MIERAPWDVAGVYFEACNCDSVCPCYSAQPPSHGFCEGNCAWHIQHGTYGDVALDGLSVLLVQRCEGLMRANPWQCWFYLDDRADERQYEALKRIFTAFEGGHLMKLFGRLWDVRKVERAEIQMSLQGWQHRASILGRLGLAVGLLKSEVGPTLCRVPNVAGVAALAEEDWFTDGEWRFDHRSQNALSTTFHYHSD